MVGAGLFLKTLANLRGVDVGFNPEQVLHGGAEHRRRRRVPQIVVVGVPDDPDDLDRASLLGVDGSGNMKRDPVAT